MARMTKEVLKKRLVEAENDLNDAVQCLRYLHRQATDREVLAKTHGEALISQPVGSVTATTFATAFLNRLEDKRKEEEMAAR